jgi:D-alanine-D-alanine ligase
VGVIDHPKLISLPVLELRPKGSFYDYHSKYTDGMTDFVIPANLTNNQTKRCQELALKTHKVVGCAGFSRTDMIVNESGPHVLEINSLPGMTDLSDLPAQAQAYGLSYDELVDSLVKSAL